MRQGTVRKLRTAVLAVVFAVFVTILSFVLDRASPRHAAVLFTPGEIDQAQREVLPFRQSGLVFHWSDDAPVVYVKRSMWNALPSDVRRQLGKSMAVAKNRREITVFDESLSQRIAVCAATSGCTPVRN